MDPEPAAAAPPLPAAAAANGGAGEDMSAAPAAGLLMASRVRRRSAVYRDCKGDYIGVPNDPCLTKILSKQGAPRPSRFFGRKFVCCGLRGAILGW